MVTGFTPLFIFRTRPACERDLCRVFSDMALRSAPRGFAPRSSMLALVHQCYWLTLSGKNDGTMFLPLFEDTDVIRLELDHVSGKGLSG
jgi:hypothetical protein